MVAYAQWLLTRHPGVAGIALPIDGIFGPQTEDAVRRAQRVESLRETGELTEPLWSVLRRGVGEGSMAIESVGIGSVSPRWSVDGYDPDVLGDRAHLEDGDSGVSVVVHGGTCFGLPGAIDRLLAHPFGRCVLLRFHGHGAPGLMVVTGGGTAGSALFPHPTEGYRRQIARLRPLFGRFGSIELHGCRVGQGDIGLRSLRIIAEETRVPVTAAYQPQMGGAFSNRFEGPVRTVFPGPTTLQAWAQRQVGSQSAATL